MKFIRKSLFRKSLLLVLLFLVVNAGGFYLADHVYQIEIIPLSILLINNGIFLVLIFSFFIFQINRPLQKIYQEISALLSGKKYQRICPSSIDEIGVFTHFFNEITQNLEKISHDLQETKRISSELGVASKIQEDILPKKGTGILGLDVVAKTKSSSEVGGDSFDFIQSYDNTFIYIGDVTGHGVPAGLIMMMVNTLIHVFAQDRRTSNEVIVETNRFLAPRIRQEMFMTLVMLRWDELAQRLFFTGAGHEHILIYRASTRDVHAVRSGGIALGMITDIARIAEEKEIKLNLEDTIVLFTDGITEAKNPQGEMYGLERLIDSLKKYGYRNTSKEIFDKLTDDFANFVGNYSQKDDITLIVIKNKGETKIKKTIELGISKEFTEDKKQKWEW
jgi:serine phosphatase RsbU (regulator of sigma subunit)